MTKQISDLESALAEARQIQWSVDFSDLKALADAAEALLKALKAAHLGEVKEFTLWRPSETFGFKKSETHMRAGTIYFIPNDEVE